MVCSKFFSFLVKRMDSLRGVGDSHTDIVRCTNHTTRDENANIFSCQGKSIGKEMFQSGLSKGKPVIDFH